MQVQELRWFAAVVADPHLTRIARELNVSQPALSRSIGRLERTVGVPLFDRVGRSLVPNPLGIRFAGHVRRAIAELDRGVEAIREALDPERGEVRLGFLLTLGTWLVPELVSGFRAEHPAIEMRLRQNVADRMIADLLEDGHDLLLTSPAPEEPAIHWHPLFEEPLRLVVPPGHRLAARRRVALREVADEPFISFREGLGLRTIIDGMCARAGFAPNVAFEGDDVATVSGLVGAGLGVAIVPVRPRTALPPHHLVISDRSSTRTVGLCWHAERYRSPAVEAFAAFVISRTATAIGT